MVKKFLMVCEAVDEFNKTVPIYDIHMADRFLRDDLRLDRMDREHVVALHLDIKRSLIGYETVSIGSLCTAVVDPKLVYKAAIMNNASGVILAHNHPSGSPVPSNEDAELTKRLKEAGKILNIQLFDHLVLGKDQTYSFSNDSTFFTGE